VSYLYFNIERAPSSSNFYYILHFTALHCRSECRLPNSVCSSWGPSPVEYSERHKSRSPGLREVHYPESVTRYDPTRRYSTCHPLFPSTSTINHVVNNNANTTPTVQTLSTLKSAHSCAGFFLASPPPETHRPRIMSRSSPNAAPTPREPTSSPSEAKP
jgi:hypothetical protein